MTGAVRLPRFVVLATCVAGVGIVLAGCVPPGSRPVVSEEELDAARAFDRHALYWVGREFEGMPLTYVASYGGISNFIYGDCDASMNACSPPLNIQVTRLCRGLEIVSFADAPMVIRGAPVGRMDGAPVLLTETVQIKVYADNEAMALRALEALYSVNDVPPVVSADEPFPPPAPGVLEGERPCDAG